MSSDGGSVCSNGGSVSSFVGSAPSPFSPTPRLVTSVRSPGATPSSPTTALDYNVDNHKSVTLTKVAPVPDVTSQGGDVKKPGFEPNSSDSDVDADKEMSELERKSREYNELPVDRGWAWVICLAGFTSYLTVGIGMQSVVIQFYQILQMYKISTTTGSLIFTCTTLSISAMSILFTNYIVPKFGERRVVVCAGFVTSLGSVGYSLAPNFWVMLACAVVKGTCIGAVLIPGVSLIRHYFHRRVSLANTMANVGTSVAIIAVPPIITILNHEYGIRGAFLISAAMELHMMVAGMLMRPVNAYKYRPKLAPLQRRTLGKKSKKGSSKGDKVTDAEVKVNGEANELLPLDEKPKSAESNGKEDSHKDFEDSALRRMSLASDLAVEAGPVPEVDITEKPGKKKGPCGNHKDSVLRLWVVRVVLLASVPSSVVQYLRSYVPTITTTQGATPDQSALLLTVMGSVDLVSRLCLGWFADTRLLKPSQIIIIGQILIGILAQFLRFFTTFETLLLMVIIMGMLIGVRLCMMPLLAQEIVGREKMPQAFSIIATTGTLCGAIANPIFGAVVDATGDFVVVLHICGVMYILGAALMLTMPLCARLDRKNKH